MDVMRQVLEDTRNHDNKFGEKLRRLEDRNSLYEEIHGLKKVRK